MKTLQSTHLPAKERYLNNDLISDENSACLDHHTYRLKALVLPVAMAVKIAISDAIGDPSYLRPFASQSEISQARLQLTRQRPHNLRT